MRLRNHPLMTRKSGCQAWPPKWTTTRRDERDTPVGEIGTLEQALMHELFDNKIFLFIEHGGFRYMGFMQFDDPAFCSQIHNLLKANLGRTIEEIGDLDLFHTL